MVFRPTLGRLPFCAVPAFLGLVAALPWLLSYSYSRGYDFFLWIYNAWFLGESLRLLDLPNWSQYAAAGQPYFKIAGLPDAFLLGTAMLLTGTFGGIKIYVAVLYVVAALGTFWIARAATQDRVAASFAAGAYVFSWFITFTVYYQGYLSNFLIYALLPWFVYLFDQSMARRCWLRAWGAAALLAVATTSNAQVAPKLLLLGGVWHLCRTRCDQWLPLLGYGALILLAALWLAAFDILSALSLRAEVFTAAYRLNTYVGPLTLVAIPLYGLDLLAEWLAGKGLAEIPLWEVLYAEYPGASVGLTAGLALAYRRGRERQVLGLWVLVLLAYGFFFLVYPALPASEWLGTSHNLMIVPTFALALLCGYGVAGARVELGKVWSRRRIWWVGGAGAGLAFAELYGLNLGLFLFGNTRTHPACLPETAVWREVAQEMRQQAAPSRFYSFNPDHTIYLFPLLTGCQTANVIELRQRLPEYQSYLDFLSACVRNPPVGFRPAAALALLNAGYVDVPSKFCEYLGATMGKGEYASYVKALQVFDRDADLERFQVREQAADDQGQVVNATRPTLRFGSHRQTRDDARVAQVVYRNRLAFPAFATTKAVAIVGPTPAGEKLFEQIVVSPGYAAGKVAFLLVDSLERLDPETSQALAGYVPVGGAEGRGGLPRLSAGELASLFEENQEPSARLDRLEYQGHEEVSVTLERKVEETAFLFLSQQCFRDWRAYDQNGRGLPVHKAGAGLTAVVLRPGTGRVSFHYELPLVERAGRWLSLTGILGSMVLLRCSFHRGRRAGGESAWGKRRWRR